MSIVMQPSLMIVVLPLEANRVTQAMLLGPTGWECFRHGTRSAPNPCHAFSAHGPATGSAEPATPHA